MAGNTVWLALNCQTHVYRKLYKSHNILEIRLKYNQGYAWVFYYVQLAVRQIASMQHRSRTEKFINSYYEFLIIRQYKFYALKRNLRQDKCNRR